MPADVTYVDTSVALAHVLAEDEYPPAELWARTLLSSRLLEFEMWTRIHQRGLTHSHEDAVRALLARIGFLDLIPEVTARAAEPFPTALRTLDALHLGTLEFVRAQGVTVDLAAYDERMRKAARDLGIPLYPL